MIQNARSKYPSSRPVLAVAGIAVNAQNEVLMVQRATEPAKGFWTYPGGKLEWGETLASGLQREFKEETGLDISSQKLLSTYEIINNNHYVILDYVVEVNDGKPVAGDDAADCKWIPIDQLGSIPITEGVMPMLKKAGY